MEKDKLMEILQPALVELEGIQKAELSYQSKVYGFYVIGGILSIALFFLSSIGASWIYVVPVFCLLLFFVVIRFTMKKGKAYQTEYKALVLKEMVTQLNPSVKYKTNNYVTQRILEESALLGPLTYPNLETSCFEGKTAQNHAFKLLELYVGNMSTTEFTFAATKGLVCILESEHYLGEHTLIQPKQASTETSIDVYNQQREKTILTLLSTRNKSTSFNEKYSVYTKRRSEADALLTKEALKEIEVLLQAWKAPVRIVFQEHKLFLCLFGVQPFSRSIESGKLNERSILATYKKLASYFELTEKWSALLENSEKIEIPEDKDIIDNAQNSAYDHFLGDEI